MIIEERAYARAGLLGNPSDGYFGKTISISVRNFGAQVFLYESPELCIEPQDQDRNTYANIYSLVEGLRLHGYYGADRLIKAAIKKFYEYCTRQGIALQNRNFTIRHHSSIPRQVGLAGSSAIITATMRALLRFYEVEIPQPLLPTLIMNAEIEELGINAGLQDRVIQVYEGCVHMNFDRELIRERGYGDYTRLDPKPLTNLYLAYNTELGKVSGAVFNDVKARFEKGDPEVLDTLAEIASLADQGRVLLENNAPVREWHPVINRNFDLRRRIMKISDRNLEMVMTARQCGASAKFAGSGGSIIGLYEDNQVLTRLIVEMKKIKARVIKPYIV